MKYKYSGSYSIEGKSSCLTALAITGVCTLTGGMGGLDLGVYIANNLETGHNISRFIEVGSCMVGTGVGAVTGLVALALTAGKITKSKESQ